MDFYINIFLNIRKPPNYEFWKISKAALKAPKSDILEMLAQPRKRESMEHAQINPNAFKIRKSLKISQMSFLRLSVSETMI